ncbi:hypothetical protein SCG7109_AB_00100 [Chlamydiales bacterium SCGC AG-110-M15]|nr:hypothetical protein SCG7109_AB_00100 [Chlamydiales bacterium SCGC AG-110-M15]
MFDYEWTERAEKDFKILEKEAGLIKKRRLQKRKGKSSRQEGLLKQVVKTLQLLQQNPRHPGLNTHAYSSLEHPYSNEEKVFEAYAQNHTPGVYRVFWCYGPQKKQITLIAITSHP